MGSRAAVAMPRCVSVDLPEQEVAKLLEKHVKIADATHLGELRRLSGFRAP